MNIKVAAKRLGILAGIVLVAIGAGYIGSSFSGKNMDKGSDKTTAKPQLISYQPINNFGVKFPYSQQDAGELVFSQNKDAVMFDSRQLAEFANSKDPANKCGLENGSLGLLYRDQTPTNNWASGNSDGMVAHIGSYYYVYISPAAPCSNDKETAAKQVKYIDLLIGDLKGMVSL